MADVKRSPSIIPHPPPEVVLAPPPADHYRCIRGHDSWWSRYGGDTHFSPILSHTSMDAGAVTVAGVGRENSNHSGVEGWGAAVKSQSPCFETHPEPLCLNRSTTFRPTKENCFPGDTSDTCPTLEVLLCVLSHLLPQRQRLPEAITSFQPFVPVPN